MNLDNWGGAQWVLAHWLLLQVTLFPLIGLRMAQDDRAKKNLAVRYASTCISVAVLPAMLAWGGFWG